METNNRLIEILILTRENCGYCEDALKIIQAYQPAKCFHIQTCSIDSPEGMELVLKNRILFPPGIFINGALFSYGRFSQRKFERFLQEKYPNIRKL